jgi:hypothetical protein
MPASDRSSRSRRGAADRSRGDADGGGRHPPLPPPRPVIRTGPRVRRVVATTFAGVDYEGNTRQDLYARACLLCVPGRSRMSKAELARAVAAAEAAFLGARRGGERTLPRAA